MPEGTFISTDLVDCSLRDEFWVEVSRPLFQVSARSDGAVPAHLEGSLEANLIGTSLVGPTTFNAQDYRRDRRLVIESGLDHYLLQLFVAGTLDADCEGLNISVGPGDIFVLDLSRTMGSRASSGSTLSAVLPRERMDKAAGRSLHGLVLRASEATTRLIADLIVSLSNVAMDLTHAEALSIEEPMLELVAAILARRPFDPSLSDSLPAKVMRQRVLEFIDANLFNRALDPALVLSRFHISRAHLYRIFAAEGGIANVVRKRRLDAAFRELTRRGGIRSSIKAVAYNLGFSGSSHFSRAFRAHFSITPSEAEQQSFRFQPKSLHLSELQSHFGKYAKSTLAS